MTAAAIEEPKDEDWDSKAITQSWVWHRMTQWMQPHDVVFGETGTAAFGIPDANFPSDIHWITQTYYGSIGFATPAALGADIALADQDDIWDQDKIGLMVNGIGNNAMIYHDSEMVDENGDALNRKISDMYNMYSGDQPYAFFFSNAGSGHALMFHNRLTPHILPFNNQFYHDWLIAIVATVHGGVKYLDKPLVKYRQHQRSTTDILNFRDADMLSAYSRVRVYP